MPRWKPLLTIGRALVVSCLLLGGCSGAVTVEQDFPVPLVERLPLRVALHYPPALSDYTYREAPAAERDWTVQLGTANVRMFDSAFSGMFQATQRVTSIDAAAQEMPGLDAIVSPSVDAFEFSLPEQSATDRYAVWIRYNLDVHGRDGRLIIRWPVTAYGQSGTSGLSDEKAMERAAVLALRDAASSIAVGFSKQQQIRESLLGEIKKNNEP